MTGLFRYNRSSVCRLLCNTGHCISALISYSGVGLFLLLALARTESGLGKQTEYFIWVTLWLLVAALVTSLLSKRERDDSNDNSGSKRGLGNFPFTDIFAVLFFVYLTVNHSFLSPVNASGRYLILLLLAMNYLSLRIVLPAYRNMGKFLFMVILVCGLREAHIGIRQLLGVSSSHHFRFAMTGTFFNPGPYGGYLSIAMSIALYYLIHYHYYFVRCAEQVWGCVKQVWSCVKQRYCRIMPGSKLISLIWKSDTRNDLAQLFLRSKLISLIRKPVIWLYLLSLATFILSFIIFFGVMSRAAMVALVVSTIFIIWHKRSFRAYITKMVKTHRKKALLFALLLVVVVGAAGVAAYLVKKDSANGRLFLWRISCNMIAERPLTGWGYGAYPAAYAQAQAEYFTKYPESVAVEVAGTPEYGFNEYLQLGAET